MLSLNADFESTLNTSTPKKSTERVAVFLGHDGTLYDIDYIPINSKKEKETPPPLALESSASVGSIERPSTPTIPSTASNDLQATQSAPALASTLVSSSSPSVSPSPSPSPSTQLEHDPVKLLQEPFPQPASYDTFFDYEQALLGWRQKIEAGLVDSSLRLPNIIGRKFSRPRVVEFQVSLFFFYRYFVSFIIVRFFFSFIQSCSFLVTLTWL